MSVFLKIVSIFLIIMSIFICFAMRLVYFSDFLASFLQNDCEDMH